MQRLHAQSQHAESETRHQAPETGLGRHPAGENAGHEYRGDRRREQRLHQPQVSIQALLAKVLQERNPQHAEHDDAGRGETADVDEVLFLGLRPQALVEVHGKQRGGGIEQ
jgi:hypothetical protein